MPGVSSEGEAPVMRPRRPRRWRRWMIVLGIAVTALTVAGWLIGREWLARAIVYAPNQGRTIDPAEDANADELRMLGVAQQFRVSVGPPDASLSIWTVEPGPPGSAEVNELRGTILVLHGINSNKRVMLGVGKMLAKAGFRAVLVDLRGHGRSSGERLTFGVRESRDLVQVIDALAERNLLAGRVGVYGPSFGGATAIMLAARDERIAAVVAIASFSSLREVVPAYVRRFIPGGWLLTDGWIDKTIARAGQLADFDPDDASPIDAIQRTLGQVLLIHGRDDADIPGRHSEALHAAAPDRTRLILVDREDHNSIMNDRTGVLSRETQAWFSRWLAE